MFAAKTLKSAKFIVNVYEEEKRKCVCLCIKVLNGELKNIRYKSIMANKNYF